MKRDMDLVRKILLQIEDDAFSLDMEGYDKRIVLRHLELLEEARLVKVVFDRTDQTGIFNARVDRLTWDGYEFLDAARSDSVWQNAKKLIGDKASSVPFAILQGLLLQLVKSSFELP